MESDGRFYGKDGRPYRYQWADDQYRLEPVTNMPGQFSVPAQMKCYHRDSLPDPIIVTSERGGGVGHFLAWLEPNRASQGRRWEIMGISEAIERLGRRAKEHESGEGSYFVIDLAHEDSEDSKDQRAQLAGLLESKEWRAERDRIICVTREVHRLREDILFSSILSRGHVFRIPHFSVQELDDWVVELAKVLPSARELRKKGDATRNLAKEARWWTGGQPTLTHMFFRSVHDRLKEEERRPDFVEVFQQAGRYLRDHRPHIVDRWGEQLRTLLKNPAVRRKLETYTSGAKADPKNLTDVINEAQLFLAGWVGLEPDGEKWAIRSYCHRQWAREFLRAGYANE